ncbi:MAG TPA: ABC-2 family transporter protein [Symbiobacteriaceae bacterium]|nr:ABC-2 family transporter protein [Symbiobacteriaceae bacterium]
MYFHYLRVYIAGLMQYRISLLLRLITTLATAAFEVTGIWVIFTRFPALGGWNMFETMLLYSVASMAFGLAEWFGRGFDIFPPMVGSGEFDRILLRPRSTVLQVLGSRFEFNRAGRVIQAGVLAAYCLSRLGTTLTPPKAALLAAAVIGGAFVYAGVFVVFATISFWTIESVQLSYVLTNCSLDMFQYPIEIYTTWLRRFFTFIVPLAAITYYPLIVILEKPDATGLPAWFPWLSPALGPLFCLASLLFWGYGVRHYHSAGS